MDPQTVVSSPELFTLSNGLSLGLALLGGKAVKALGKKYEEGGGPPVQKVLSPLAAIAIAVGVQAATKGQVGAEAVLSYGGTLGVLASGAQAIGKNAIELAKVLFGKRPK